MKLKTFNVRFKFKDKGIQTTIQAENEAMAKQRILALIHFVDIQEVDSENEIINFFKGFSR